MKRKHEADDLQFEIEFFEGILERCPDYEEPLMALGYAYTRSGQYEKGLSADQRLLKLRPYDPIAYYNLACSLSLMNRIDQAFSALERAMELGYSDCGSMLKDPDLRNLRNDPRFSQIILSRLEK
jgi:tetratricopeptide (TPR) repeat protein